MGTLLILAWIICPIIAGIVASKKKLQTGLWVLGTLLLSPLLLLILLAVPARESHDGERKCPACAEWVKREATVCKHCKKDLPAIA